MAPNLKWEEIMDVSLNDLEGEQGDEMYEQLAEVCCLTLVVTVPVLFGKMHFLLTSENEFFYEIKSN